MSQTAGKLKTLGCWQAPYRKSRCWREKPQIQKKKFKE